MLSLVLGAAAVPAKRGLWKTLRLADGQEVRARLTGDDIVHYYQSESGDCYVTGQYRSVSTPHRWSATPTCCSRPSTTTPAREATTACGRAWEAQPCSPTSKDGPA